MALFVVILDGMNNDAGRLDSDMGDDDQEDEIREYERYIEDPPANLIIRESDSGYAGISRELREEWTRSDRAAEDREEDNRPAEVAAIDIIDDEDM